MRGIVKTLMTNSEEPIEIYGFEDGYQGLIYSRFRVMTPADFSGILTRGGTILGTSRTPFKRLNIPEADGVEKVPAMVHTYHKLQLDCLFMLGGNGSTKTANRLREEGLNVITLPKTIDNDTWAFRDDVWLYERHRRRHQVHRRHPHHRFKPWARIRYRDHGPQGWLDPAVRRRRGRCGCHLIPEDPLRHGPVIKTIEHRMETGSRFTIVAVAEGAISKEDAALSKKEYKKKLAERTSPSIVYDIAARSRPRPVARPASPSPVTRSAVADAQDRIFATQCGVEAALGCLRGEFGYMIALRDGKMCPCRSRRSPASSSMSTPRAIWCARPRRWASASATNSLGRNPSHRTLRPRPTYFDLAPPLTPSKVANRNRRAGSEGPAFTYSPRLFAFLLRVPGLK